MTFEESLAATTGALQGLAGMRPAVERAGRLVVDALRGGGKLLIGGNGGSAAEAAHFATELAGRYQRTRKPLAAISLADGPLVTCIGNDFGFEQALARQVQALARKGDLVVLLSSSGDSPNVVAALREAARLGVDSLALLGRGGGKCKGLANCEIVVPGASGAAAQEAHLFLIHHFCELIDEAFPA